MLQVHAFSGSFFCEFTLMRVFPICKNTCSLPPPPSQCLWYLQCLMIAKRELRSSEPITPAPHLITARAENARSIIGLPAIGSDPNSTWIRAGEGRDHENPWLGAALQKMIPSAKVLIYDHLNSEERKLEMNVTLDQNRENHRTITEKFAEAEAAVAEYGIERWADRFLKVLLQDRKVRRV